MERSLIIAGMCALVACGDGFAAGPDAGMDASSPDAAQPLPPEAGGAYVVKVSPTRFWCANSGDQPANAFHAVVDVVPQGDRSIDLLSGMPGTFVEFDRYDLERDGGGSFDGRWEGYAAFWDFWLTVFRDIENSSADGRALAFDHRYDIGWRDEQDVYHRECVYEARIEGSLWHERWDGAPKDGVSGQWHARREVLASPLYETARAADGTMLDPNARPEGTVILFRDRAGGMIRALPAETGFRPVARKRADTRTPGSSRKALSRADLDRVREALPANGPEPGAPHLEPPEEPDALLMDDEPVLPLLARNAVLSTLSQSGADDLIELRGIYRTMGGWIHRDPQTGAIDAWMLVVMPYLDSDGAIRTMHQETRLTGTILPTELRLEETWRWWTAATDTLPETEHWFQHERYEGAPRHMPHARATEEPTHGTYVASYALTENDCGFAPYAYHRVLNAVPGDDGTIWPRVTGFDREPYVTPDATGRFSVPFTRITNAWRYDYAIDGTIDGHAVDLDMTVARRDRNTGALDCTTRYEITGEKLYMTARP